MLEEAADTVGAGSQPVCVTKKRKRNAPSKAVADHANDDDAQAASSPPKKKKATPRKKDEEKRLRRFRQKAPESYLEKLHRATTQRYATYTSV